MPEQADNRIYTAPFHHWTESQTKELLNSVIAIHQNNGHDALEKPTAKQFYEKIAENSTTLDGLHWLTIKFRLNQLKQLFFITANWRRSTPLNMTSKATKERLYCICPHWDVLIRLFGHQVPTTFNNLANNHNPDDGDNRANEEEEENNGAHQIQELAAEPVEQAQHENIPQVEKSEEVVEKRISPKDLADDAPVASTSSAARARIATPYQFEFSTSSPLRIQESPQSTATNAALERLHMLVNLQEKQLEFKGMKWKRQLAMEQEKLKVFREEAANIYEINKVELEHETELKDLTKDHDVRFTMAKMKHVTDLADKIKRFEVELKVKAREEARLEREAAAKYL